MVKRKTESVLRIPYIPNGANHVACKPQVLDEGSAALPRKPPTDAAPLVTSAAERGTIRSDLPKSIPRYGRGSKQLALQIAGSTQSVDAAEANFVAGFSAPSASLARDSKLKTWSDIALTAGFLDPFKLTPSLITKVAGILKAANYRSIPSYISLAMDQHVMLHGPIPANVVLTRKKANRSALRGIGPAKHTRELPMERLPEATEFFQADIIASQPAHPVRVITIGSWFLAREIEMAAANLDDISFRSLDGAPLVDVYLPSQKNDLEGSGCTRTHTCICKLKSRELCPYHLCLDQHAFASSIAKEGTLSPFAPTWDGERFTKLNFVSAVMLVCQRLGIRTHTHSGAPLITGHVMRATGAIFLAELGVELWRIQLLGRWGSEAVKLYIRSAPLKAMNDVALEAFLKKDLHALAGDISALKAAIIPNKAADGFLPAVAKSDLLQSRLRRSVFAPPLLNEFVLINLDSEPQPCCHRQATDISTRCGWKFAGKNFTINEILNSSMDWSNAQWRLCRDCFGNPPAEVAEVSSGESASSSSDSS